MLSFVLCDDNNSIRTKLEQMLEKIFISNDISAEITLSCANPNDVINYISLNKVDVLLLDVELNSNLSGIDISKELRKNNKDAYIIFLSGYMDYVFESLKSKIFDYLLKPISYEKLERCILRLINDITKSNNKYITLPNNKITLREDDITFIEKNKMKAIIYANNRKYETYSSLDKLENCLSDNFKRCHKSYIINTDKISQIDSSSNTIYFNNNLTCSLGQKYKTIIMEGINVEPNTQFLNDAK